MEQDYPNKIEQAYRDKAKDYSDFFNEAHSFLDPDREAFLRRLPENAAVLDCGCGPGQDSEVFSNLGFQVTGVDLTASFIAMSQKRVPSGKFYQIDMRKMNFPAQSFDGIWVSFSLLHIKREDVASVLVSFHRFLKPSGVLMLALHKGEKTAWVEANISGIDTICRVQEWTEQDIKKELIHAGFKIIDCRLFTRKGGRFPLMTLLSGK